MDEEEYIPKPLSRTRKDMYESLYFPGLSLEPRIAHYYGDIVRKLFMINAAFLLVIEPFLSSETPWVLPFAIAGAVVLVIFAALTSPRKQLVMVGNAMAATVGLIAFEAMAIYSYFSGSMALFIIREIPALFFLLALYYSVKTIRAMTLGIIGKRTVTGEFLRRDPRHFTRGFSDSGD